MFSKDLLIATVVSIVWFGLAGYISYNLAVEIHTQGTDILSLINK